MLTAGLFNEHLSISSYLPMRLECSGLWLLVQPDCVRPSTPATVKYPGKNRFWKKDLLKALLLQTSLSEVLEVGAGRIWGLGVLCRPTEGRECIQETSALVEAAGGEQSKGCP